MRLVVCYTKTDDCTFWADVILPFIYESAEQLAVDFEWFCKKDNKYKDFILCGHDIDPTDFFDRNNEYDGPTILTLDEWFEAVEAQYGR